MHFVVCRECLWHLFNGLKTFSLSGRNTFGKCFYIIYEVDGKIVSFLTIFLKKEMLFQLRICLLKETFTSTQMVSDHTSEVNLTSVGESCGVIFRSYFTPKSKWGCLNKFAPIKTINFFAF